MKRRPGKLTYVHNVKLLTNAGDLPPVQIGHRWRKECQEQERQGNKSEADLKTRRSCKQTTRRDLEKSLHSSF
jgi:hypothetical protein